MRDIPCFCITASHYQESLNTVVKIKEFLDEHNIYYDDTMPSNYLRGQAKKRIDLLSETASPGAKRACQNVNLALTAEALVKKSEKMRESGENGKVFDHAVMVLDDMTIGKDIVKKKHEIGQTATCRGVVTNQGKCFGCGRTNVSGIVTYSFSMFFRSINPSSPLTFVKVGASEAAGASLFKMSAADFYKLSEQAKDKLRYDVLQEPFHVGVIVNYVKNKDEIFILGYSMEQLPPSVMGETMESEESDE